MLRLNALRHRVRFGAESLVERVRNAHPGAVPAGARLLISVHVPKTAGTSFRRFLGAAYGRRLFFDYGPHNPMTTALVRRSMYLAADAERGQELLGALIQRGRVTHFELARPSLHDIFIRIAGPEACEAAEESAAEEEDDNA